MSDADLGGELPKQTELEQAASKGSVPLSPSQMLVSDLSSVRPKTDNEDALDKLDILKRELEIKKLNRELSTTGRLWEFYRPSTWLGMTTAVVAILLYVLQRGQMTNQLKDAELSVKEAKIDKKQLEADIAEKQKQVSDLQIQLEKTSKDLTQTKADFAKSIHSQQFVREVTHAHYRILNKSKKGIIVTLDSRQEEIIAPSALVVFASATLGDRPTFRVFDSIESRSRNAATTTYTVPTWPIVPNEELAFDGNKLSPGK